MKIGLLTLPLKDNYGGNLQAIALSSHLEALGHEVTLIQKAFFYPFWKRIVIALLERLPFQNIKKFRSMARNSGFHQSVIDAMIPRKTRRVVTGDDLSSVTREHEFDAVVVGSDQVWRMEYIDKVYFGAYFLDFLEGASVRRVSYAASFGVDSWQSPETVPDIKRWLSGFDAISVREASGLELCSGFGRPDAELVLDPTLLVGREFYQPIIDGLPNSSRRTLLCYVLDESDSSERALADVVAASADGLEVKRIYNQGDAFQTHTLPEWVKAFAEAEFVLTDSFHGMVFSIMFNKPFLAIANRERGASRFESFLAQLGLQERLLGNEEGRDVNELLKRQINYEAVNARLAQWRAESVDFLQKALSI